MQSPVSLGGAVSVAASRSISIPLSDGGCKFSVCAIAAAANDFTFGTA